MPAFIRLVIRGALPGGEVFSVNPAYTSPGETSDYSYVTAQEMADQCAALTVPGPVRSLLSIAARIVGYRVEIRDIATGALTDAADADIPEDGIAGTGTINKPNRSAIVFSLSGTSASRRSRGRLYWPALSFNVFADTGKANWPTAEAQRPELGMRDYLKDLGEALEAPSGPAGLPRIAVYSPTDRLLYPSTTLRLGDIPDRIQKRADRLTESYRTTSLL